MKNDIPHALKTTLRVDGGMTFSNLTMQFLSDILDVPIDRPSITETTALGAAWLAGMRAGFYPDQTGFSDIWQLDKRFEPSMDGPTRDKYYAGWHDAVSRTLISRG